MHLSHLDISGLRSCASTHVRLQPTLTLLVGENNAGKSNVIDAIRLATHPLSGRRNRYFELDDVHRSANHQTIELQCTYGAPSEMQRGQFITALDIEANEVVYGVKFSPDLSGRSRGKVETYAGRAKGPDLEPEKRAEINHVYLEPLRDAKRELDSASGLRLSQIIRYLTAKADQDEFVAAANAGLRELEKHQVLKSTQGKIQEHLTDLTAAVRPHSVGLGFADYQLHRLARNLRLKMAEQDIDLADVAESGLGYSNLLYIATLILELRNAQESELTVFLVEEPEAHLHPQLQGVMLDYLKEQAEQSIRDDTAGRAGRIQIVATTHSPNLASAVGLENIVVLRSKRRSEAADSEDAVKPDDAASSDQMTSAPDVAAAEQFSLMETSAIALADLDLTPSESRKINQYLDATRSELLFARRVVLLEGIAEAVLLPALADYCLYPGSSDEARRNRRALRGASIVSVGSVDFAPYLKVLLQEVDGVRLVDQVVVVTDGDPQLSDESVLQESGTEAFDGHDPLPSSCEVEADNKTVDEEPEVSSSEEVRMNRGSILRSIVSELGADSCATVVEARFTLEADLMEPTSRNATVLRAAFLAQKPRSAAVWQALADDASPAEAMYQKLRSNKTFLAKGQFAHDVAALLATTEHEFECPAYLVDAIRKACSA